ncbi:MAG: FG-GAP repeat protein, partial [Thermoanaerobaculia bacterium]|nr:FG-GAP repeat protein [Thermoanaerobaculia bacterium]
GDGHDDLAVGLPGNDYFSGTGVIGMGGVQLHFGLPDAVGRIQSIAAYSFSQVAGGLLPGRGLAGERFGAALAFGDFNGDQREDLAVGIPNDAVGCGSEDCYGGSVMVVDLDGGGHVNGYLMSLGLDALPASAAAGDHFGGAVATGDFNGDRFDDLAIGIPGRDSSAGGVLVVFGSEFSLIFGNHQLLDQGVFGEPVEPGDLFGSALAAGDFNGDGFADLAMAAPEEDGNTSGSIDSGQVIVAYGSAGGLSTVGAPWLSEDGIFGAGSESGDRFGSALTAGDFDGDGLADLVIGVFHEGVFGADAYGAAVALRGRPEGLAGSPSRRLFPGDPPIGMIPGDGNLGAGYGSALATGDFDGNGFADLAIGAPARTPPSLPQAGAVAVVYGQLFVDGFESRDPFEWAQVAP